MLERFVLEQLDEKVALAAGGSVNDKAFSLRGEFPRQGTFDTSAEFGELKVVATGERGDEGNGFDADLTIESTSFADLLQVLDLTYEFDGEGSLTASLRERTGTLEITDLATSLQLDDGRKATLSGSVGSLFELAGIDLALSADLVKAGTIVERAARLQDIRLLGLEAAIVSHGQGLELEDLNIETNALEREFRNIGPLSIDRVVRTIDGKLGLSGVAFQIGPEDSPLIIAKGGVDDIFGFKGVELEGSLHGPARLALPHVDPARAAELGAVDAEFRISDETGAISLVKFTGATSGTELWSLDADIAVGDIRKLAETRIALSLDVSDSKRLLEALDVKPVDAGELGFSVDVNGDGLTFDLASDLRVGVSNLDIEFASKKEGEKPIFRGKVASPQIAVSDLKKAAAFGGQFARVFARKADDDKAGEKIKPLVIELPEETDVKPLVLPEEEVKLVSGERMLKQLDLLVGVAIDKIDGAPGVSGVHGDLTVLDGKAKFGPLKARYGGGYFDLHAAMNLADRPYRAGIKGVTGGWNLGEILDTFGVGYEARGELHGDFDIYGNVQSMQGFLDSMNGKANIRMENGRLDTSLLDLAGLGVMQWLFSKELRQGYTEIVCLIAPVAAKGGRVTTTGIVAETRSVQLVVKGEADWRRDTVSIRVEPRPVGRPFARSAFPVEVSGKLTEPSFKILFTGLPGEGTGPHRRFGRQEPEADHKPCGIGR